jgi:hypothetical protein
VTVLRKEAALPRQGTAKVRDDEQKSSMRRAHWDEPAPQGEVLYPSQGVSVNSAFVYRKACVYPGRSATMSVNRTDRTVRGGDHVAEVSRGHSSRPKRAGPPENGRSIPGGLTPMKAPTVPGPNGLGKWSWLSKSMFLPAYCSGC